MAVIKEYINVRDDRLLDGLTPVVRLMTRVEALSESDAVTIDFGDTVFITPVCALSMIVYLAGCGRKVSMRNIPDYLETIGIPRKGYLDICMADNGVTLLGSYKKLSDNEIIDDLEAIKAANRGISSKNLPEAENRGYGIQTSKRMLVEGLGGQYLMISGSCLYLKSPGHDNVYSVPDGLRWNGTIVALRIPVDSSQFNYVNYLE